MRKWEPAIQSQRLEAAVKLPAVVLLLAMSALPQRPANTFPKPPMPAETQMPNSRAPRTQIVHVDPVQLQREAKELLELSQSVQPDIDRISHGLLPKDTIEKLKRIEKVSKHLRGELSP